MADTGGGVKPEELERFLSHFILQSGRGWAWGWPSAVRLSKHMGAGFGRPRTMAPALRFGLVCPFRVEAAREIPGCLLRSDSVRSGR